jgi:hypothetical protein
MFSDPRRIFERLAIDAYWMLLEVAKVTAARMLLARYLGDDGSRLQRHLPYHR